MKKYYMIYWAEVRRGQQCGGPVAVPRARPLCRSTRTEFYSFCLPSELRSVLHIATFILTHIHTHIHSFWMME